MAEENKAVDTSVQAEAVQPKKSEKVHKENKKPGLFARAAKWFRELKSEAKKVVWPNPQQVGKNTLIVGACCGVVGVCIWLFDLVANAGIDLIITIPTLFG